MPRLLLRKRLLLLHQLRQYVCLLRQVRGVALSRDSRPVVPDKQPDAACESVNS
jgi:hypothetical protein